jgi:hypothetical protein
MLFFLLEVLPEDGQKSPKHVGPQLELQFSLIFHTLKFLKPGVNSLNSCCFGKDTNCLFWEHKFFINMLFWKMQTILNSKEGGIYSSHRTLNLKREWDLNSNYFPTETGFKFTVTLNSFMTHNCTANREEHWGVTKHCHCTQTKQ